MRNYWLVNRRLKKLDKKKKSIGTGVKLALYKKMQQMKAKGSRAKLKP
jgi:hypothetical protein